MIENNNNKKLTLYLSNIILCTKNCFIFGSSLEITANAPNNSQTTSQAKLCNQDKKRLRAKIYFKNDCEADEMKNWKQFT